MVMKMNKTDFLKELSEITKFDMEKCEIINEVIENNCFIGKNNKIKLVDDLVERLGITEQEADDVYEKAMRIIARGLKEKIKHPFKDKD